MLFHEKVYIFLWITVAMATSSHIAPEIHRGGFVPSPDQVVVEAPEDVKSDKKASPRFGATTVEGGNIELGLTLTAPFLNIPLTTGAHQYGGTIGNLVPGAYAPLKYDLGGLVMAGALALGSIFLLPKFLPASDDFINNGLYPPGLGRSDTEKPISVNETRSPFLDVVNKMNSNIASSACVYKVICYAIHNARHTLTDEKASSMDAVMQILTRVPVLREYIPERVREIAEKAWSREDGGCEDENVEGRCPINADTMKIVMGALLSGRN